MSLFERWEIVVSFLSWKGESVSKRLEWRKQEIAEAGGQAKFIGLYEGERRVIAQAIAGEYGMVWLLHESEEAKFGRRFIPYGEQSRVQKKLGLSERLEWQKAFACVEGGEARVVRVGGRWGQEAVLVKE
jgi:hypothetical protein